MEIAQIAEVVSRGKIVGLGESSHGTHEFFEFKSELFRRLVTDHGFNTLLFEDSKKACRSINDYISGKDLNLTSICNQLYPMLANGGAKTAFSLVQEPPVSSRGFIRGL